MNDEPFPTGRLEPPPELLERPSSVLFWGPDRHLLSLAAFGLARRIAGEFTLVDILDPAHPTERDGIFSLVPEARRVVVGKAEELVPNEAASNLALFGVLRNDGPPAELERLVDFLWLPAALQEAVSRSGRERRPGPVLLTNGHVLEHVWRSPAEPLRRIFGVLNHEGLTPIVTEVVAAPRSVPATAAYDYVFRLLPKPHRHWKEALLFLERARTRCPIPLGVPLSASAFRPFAEGCEAEDAALSSATSRDRHWLFPW